MTARTTLITWIFLSPAPVRIDVEGVLLLLRAAPSPPPAAGAAATATGAAAVTPHSSSIAFLSSTSSSTVILPSESSTLLHIGGHCLLLSSQLVFGVSSVSSVTSVSEAEASADAESSGALRLGRLGRRQAPSAAGGGLHCASSVAGSSVSTAASADRLDDLALLLELLRSGRR
mgnify:CR=1 FL=1